MVNITVLLNGTVYSVPVGRAQVRVRLGLQFNFNLSVQIWGLMQETGCSTWTAQDTGWWRSSCGLSPRSILLA